MSVMTIESLTMHDVFDVAHLHGATARDLRGSVDYIIHLGNTDTPEARDRMGDLALTGYLYERGWL